MMKNSTHSNGRRPLSAIVTTFNEERNLAACLDSLTWCDEVLVVDSFSTDGTLAIAGEYPNVRVLERRYFGPSSQKNWAIEQVRHDWVLILDADERCTPGVQREIGALLEHEPDHPCYTFARKTWVLGGRVRYSGWQQDRVIRLFKRGHAYYEDRLVHEKMKTSSHAPMLRHPLEHRTVDCLHEYLGRVVRYGYWGAAQAWSDGRKSGPLKILGRSGWRFVKTYVFQFGFLDGARGVVFCLAQAYATYVKWALLWGWRVNAARGIEPDLPARDPDELAWRGLRKIESGKRRG